MNHLGILKGPAVTRGAFCVHCNVNIVITITIVITIITINIIIGA